MNRSHAHPSSANAFTLIELLTVITIIGILASILIAVLGKVRQSARTAICLSNLRQAGIAILLYTDENRGSFPTQPEAGSAPGTGDSW